MRRLLSVPGKGFLCSASIDPLYDCLTAVLRAGFVLPDLSIGFQLTTS